MVIVVPEDVFPIRVDLFLTQQLTDISRTQIQKLIEEGRITLEGKAHLKSSLIVEPGMVFRVEIPPPIPLEVVPEDIPLEILYEDEHLIAVNKPPGMSVHPAGPHRTGTLVNALLYHVTQLSGIGGVSRPGIVHRLDKVTSGVILAAKTDLVHQALCRDFKARKMRKVYWALVKGVPFEKEGEWRGGIGRDTKNRKKMAVCEDGRPSRTLYQIREVYGRYCWLTLQPVTGRTHQIRVHLESARLSVIGDSLYGFNLRKGENPALSSWMKEYQGIALHAYSIQFIHPFIQKELIFEALPPEGWKNLQNLLIQKRNMV